MTPARITMMDLPEAVARTLAQHAAVSAADGRTDVVAITAYPIGSPPPVGITIAFAVGSDVSPAAQRDALRDGAADVIDVDWAPEYVASRLAHLVERETLRRRIATELAAKERELADARALQLALVPPSVADERVAVDVVLEPATELGGDLVDHVRIDDGRIMLALGDVSGKGAAAALTMARTHTLLRSIAIRSYAADLLSPPDTAARRLNGMLAIENDGCMFVTMFLGLLDPQSGVLDYVRCGQIPPFLRRADGTVERLDTVGGLPLGVLEDADYAVGRTIMRRGDVLLVVSDGVTEAEAPDEGLFGEEPVLEWLTDPREELGSLIALARAHEAGRPATDDLSAMLVRLR